MPAQKFWAPIALLIGLESVFSQYGGNVYAQPSANSLVVVSTGDSGDAMAGDGRCDDGTGVCTLRAAIEEINAAAEADTIAFNIAGAGPHTIQPGSELPAVTRPVTIDGTTEPDYAGTPAIELDGSLAGEAASGLTMLT